MPFIHTFGGAMKVLTSIKKGTCTGTCRSGWIRNFKYALQTKTNPLHLTSEQRKILTKTIKDLKNLRIKEIKK
jgi:hypothetical protein